MGYAPPNPLVSMRRHPDLHKVVANHIAHFACLLFALINSAVPLIIRHLIAITKIIFATLNGLLMLFLPICRLLYLGQNNNFRGNMKCFIYNNLNDSSHVHTYFLQSKME